MLQVQRNLTNGSVSGSKNFVNLVRTESSIVDHMELSLYKSTCDNRTLKKTVLVFIGYEYTVSFYDIAYLYFLLINICTYYNQLFLQH